MMTRRQHTRGTLSAEQVVLAAVAVADRGGLAAVSMRRVGQELGVEAMSLYHHVTGKEALLDGLTDWVFAQIALPGADDPWRGAMSDRALSARAALSAHPWALGLIESRRSPGPALLRHHDRVLSTLRGNGFSVALAAHAFSAIDSYVQGFVLTELNLPFGEDESPEDFVAQLQDVIPADEYPHLVEMITEQVVGRGYAYADEFGFGLDLVLDGLELHLARERAAG